MSTNNSRRSARQSTFPQINSASTSAVKARHLSHLHSQLAQLSANLADLENLMRMTAVQAEYMRGLGGYCGSLFMASSKVLGEEADAKAAGGVAQRDQSAASTRDDEGTST